ncbi:MAG: hypothetical protein EBS06_05790 [Proteobacteria bacterium]|nr:hypothetical protein [Pseudomonadota bacterium]
MHKFFLVLIFTFLIGCSSVESPVVYFSNASPNPIKNIECNWNGNLLSLAALNPGDSRSQSFFISSDAKFFGPVYVTWYNAKGDRMSKNFNFRKENLPSIADKTTYNYVQFYFDQEDIEISSSDVVDLTGKVRRMEQVMNKYHDDFLHSGVKASLCANNNLNVCQAAESSALISVKKKQLEFAPGTY